MTPLGALRSSLALLTRIPMGSRPFTAGEQSWAPACFPLVGALIGLLTAGTLTLLRPLGNWGAATVAVGLSVWLTGALHEDGLADTADALGGSASPEQALTIMKDSRIGSYGSLALILVLLARIGFLARIGSPAMGALVVSGLLARLAPLWLMTHLEHAAPTRAKQPEFTRIPRSRAWVGSALAALVAVTVFVLGLAAPGRLLAALVLTVTVTLAVGRTAHQRLGGTTGDVLGASEQLCEAGILGAFAWQS